MSDSEMESQPAGQDDELETIVASLDDGDSDAIAASQTDATPDVSRTTDVNEVTVEPDAQAPVASTEANVQPLQLGFESETGQTSAEPAEPSEVAGSVEVSEPSDGADGAEPGFLGAIDEPVATSAPTWPFVVYEGVWAVFAAAIVLVLRDIPAGPVYTDRLYAASVAVGLALTGLGPILIVVVWLLAGGTRKGQRGAVFVSALLKGAVATFLGVVLWIVALVVLDQLRLGSVL